MFFIPPPVMSHPFDEKDVIELLLDEEKYGRQASDTQLMYKLVGNYAVNLSASD